LITDSDLNVVEEGPELVISQPSEVLELMNEWNVKQHTSTGAFRRKLNPVVS
jgi:Oligoribonuclease (3''->5'' exoribonuclease)